MKQFLTTLLLFSLFAAQGPPAAHSQEEKAKTHEVKPEKFEIQLELSGVFTAEKAHEVSIEPKSWSQFEVLEAVPHGAQVTAGQILVRFDLTEINESIEDTQSDEQIAELAIIQAEEELPRLEKALRLQFEAAERTHQIASEDFQRWQEIDRPLSLKSIEYSLKYYKTNLEYQEEELEQLEKMYKADDLTEETEEIILKRQRDAVDQARFSFELAENRHEESLELLIPRTDASVKMGLEQAELELAQAKAALEFSTSQRQFALEKTKHLRQRSLEKHAEILADRELMTVKSPVAGTVYYGRAVDGKWSGTQSLIESLQPGGSVSPETVFMTIVQMRPLVVLASVTEKDVVDVRAGAVASLAPTADDETQIAGQIAETSLLPVGEGQFPLKVSVSGDAPEWVVPGMTCKVKVTTYTKDDALTVPAAAVNTDEEDKEKQYVLVQAEGKPEPERRDVKAGKTHGGKTEILEGLMAGDRVVVGDAKPEEETDEKPAGATDAKPAEETTEEATDGDEAKPEEEKPAEEGEEEAADDVENPSEATE